MPEVIDLPAAPLSMAYEEGPLAGAPVVVESFDGARVTGLLDIVDAPRGRLTIRRREDGAALEFYLVTLRKVEFSMPLIRARGAAPLATNLPGILLYAAASEYAVTYKDGKAAAGRFEAHVADHVGLHFFSISKRQRLRRSFIPHAAIDAYRIGRLLGEELAAAKAVPAKVVEEALNLQRQIVQRQQQAAISKTVAVAPAIATARTAAPAGTVVPLRKRAPDPIGSKFDAENASHDPSTRIGRILSSQGVTNDRQIAEALSRKFGLPLVELRKAEITDEAIKLVQSQVVRDTRVLPIKLVDTRLIVATDDPTNTDGIHLVGFTTGRTLEIVVASQSDIDWAIEFYYGLSSVIEQFLPDNAQAGLDTEEEARRLATNRPIVKLVDEIIGQAIHRRASDIHVRPGETDVELLFRIDGSLILIRTFKKNMLLALIIRMKVMGNMNVAQHHVPQDGQIRIVIEGATYDLRVSIIPTVNGESIVVRVLNSKFGPKVLDELGLDPGILLRFRNLLKKMHGMILVTGPTGSGKSTTLYAALNELRSDSVNIITVEDPVEFHVASIEQVQVDTSVGLTFSRVLRNILRHDPDIIMVGEIRDEETARIATQSSLTGHLVLSTLHTNSAAGAITRLMDMHVESYLLAPTILCIVAQRLLRRNCPDCLVVENVGDVLRRELKVAFDEQFFAGTGCDSCSNTGVRGRIAAYEMLFVTVEVQEAIKRELGEEAIAQAAVSRGMQTLLAHAIELARRGEVSLAEVYKLSTPT